MILLATGGSIFIGTNLGNSRKIIQMRTGSLSTYQSKKSTCKMLFMRFWLFFYTIRRYLKLG